MNKIGYMGIPGSFSEIAAQELTLQAGFTDVSYHPLICAQNILKELECGAIDYGVLAVENSSAGPVKEFVETFDSVDYEHLKTLVLPIHHCLFKRSADIPDEHLTVAASHPQALAQTRNTRAARFKTLAEQEIEDTAIGAEWLSKGLLPDTTAVICSKGAGQSWNLHLIAENIEDSDTNRTTFWLLRLK